MNNIRIRLPYKDDIHDQGYYIYNPNDELLKRRQREQRNWWRLLNHQGSYKKMISS